MKCWMPLLLCLSLNLVAADPGLQRNLIDHFFVSQTKKPVELPKTSDYAFIRRVYLDFTGRLPQAQELSSFIASKDADKRARLIDQLLESEAFTLRWTAWFEDLFQNQRLEEAASFRNAFHETLHQMVAENRSWKDMAIQLIARSGRAQDPGSNFILYGTEFYDFDTSLDMMDDLAGNMADRFLGIQINCISCHDGAYHLEDINKGLAGMKRQSFWAMAAMMAGVQLYLPKPYEQYDEADPAAIYRDFFLVDLDDPSFRVRNGVFPFTSVNEDGSYGYYALSEAGDGMRSPRNGGLIAPAYLFTGEQPAPGEIRREALARMITSDRQFARNMANRIWEHFIGVGFISQPNGWDPGRLDPDTAASLGTTVLARDWELLEELTDFFLQSDYDLRLLMALIAKSDLYQVDYTHIPALASDGNLRYWAADRRVRRIEAEAILDSIYQTLETPRRYAIRGYGPNLVTSTWALPDSEEPTYNALEGPPSLFRELGYENEDEYIFMQYTTMDILTSLGRGDRLFNKKRDNSASTQTVLTLLNNWELHYSLDETPYRSPWLLRLNQDLRSGKVNAAQVVDQMYQRILIRPPTSAEASAATAYFQGRQPDVATMDLAWALFNHHDFIYK